MDIRECYLSMGGDFDEVVGRLHSEKLIERFAVKFLSDKTFAELEDGMKASNIEEAFRAAHTLKGLCQNLGFKSLYEPSSELTEALRNGKASGADELFERVKEGYQKTVAAIKLLDV